MSLPAATTSVLRGIAHLSVGTFVIQSLGAMSQVVFAFWLQPADYGLWAAATASMVLFSGLVNLGEVNAYLSAQVGDLAASRRMIWRTNCTLMVGGAFVVVAYGLAGRAEVAVLVALTALNLPLLGESTFLYAAYVRQRRNGTLIRAQVLSSVARTMVGVLIAWATGSALAFAVSMICYSLVMILVLRAPTSVRGRAALPSPAVPRRVRIKWSVHSLAAMLPSQTDYLVISLVASPGLLGVYYLSYQITVALAALVSGPLSKSALSALSQAPCGARRELSLMLMAFASGGIGIVVCFGVVAVVPLGGFLPDAWREAVPTVCILLASLPARMLSVVADAVLVAEDRWWRSARLNGVDAAGTAVAALFALSGSVVSIAVAVVSWQVAFAAVRVSKALPGAASAQLLLLLAPNVLAAALLTVGVSLAGGWIWAFVAMSSFVATAPLLTVTGSRTRRADLSSANR